MDRSKAEQGRGREKRKIRKEKCRRERVRRKKMQMREKVGKSRNIVFFQWFVAPEGRKVDSLKRRVRSQLARWEMKNCTPLWREAHFQVKMYKAHHCRTTFGSWDVEQVHAVVARSIFPSRKRARRCGAKHISKSKCTKHTMLGPLLEVETVRIKRHVVFTQRKKLHREDFTQKPLHREGFTQSSFYTDAFAHRCFYIQKLLHRKAFSKRSLSTLKPLRRAALHTDAFSQRSFYTGTLTRRCPSFYTQDLLHTHTLQKKLLDTETFTAFSQESFYTEAFAQRCLYKQKL